jgi:hypothetical protein
METNPATIEIEQTMARWELNISDETDRRVRDYLARTGSEAGDLSRFVEQTVRRQIFWATVHTVKSRAPEVPSKQLQAIIDEAVVQARTGDV